MTEIDTTTYMRIAKLQDTNERHKAIENFINQHFKLIEKNYIEDDTGAVFEISEDSSNLSGIPDGHNIQDFYAAYDIYDKDSHSVVRRRIRGIRVANAALLGLGGLVPLW